MFFFVFYLYNPMLSYVWVSDIFCMDSIGVILFILTLWITAMMFLSRQRIYIGNNNGAYFVFVVLVLMLVLLMTFRVNNVMLFYIMFEISLIPTLVIILGWGYQPERLQAGMYLIMYTITASLPLLMGLLFIYGFSGRLFMYFPL